jgi:hypothetical protein
VSDDLPAGRFFGFYLQIVDRRDGERKQFLVLPPVEMPPHNASGKIVWWERAQFVNAQRPAWKMLWEGQSQPTFRDRIEFYLTAPEWIISEPIVVKVTQTEVSDWVKAKKTPYDFIRRLERRARLKNIQIQGPTSIPQVVTAPPSS